VERYLGCIARVRELRVRSYLREFGKDLASIALNSSESINVVEYMAAIVQLSL